MGKCEGDKKNKNEKLHFFSPTPSGFAQSFLRKEEFNVAFSSGIEFLPNKLST